MTKRIKRRTMFKLIGPKGTIQTAKFGDFNDDLEVGAPRPKRQSGMRKIAGKPRRCSRAKPSRSSRGKLHRLNQYVSTASMGDFQ